MKFQLNKIPWPQIHDFLVEMGMAHDTDGFLNKVLSGVERLIPFDITANVASIAGIVINGEGARAGAAIANVGSEKYYPMYHDYYIDRFPEEAFQLINSVVHFDWTPWENTEFVADFIRPQGIRHTMSGMFDPSYRIVLNLHRSRRSPAFNDRDAAVINILTPHLNNIYSYLTTINTLQTEHYQAAELAKGCRLLSKREAEVAVLLCKRLKPTEIATVLLISPRTVERHIANIYEKLDVRNKRELILKLPPEK